MQPPPQADCKNYKHVDDLWIVQLRNMRLECNSETIALEKLCVMATKSQGDR